METILELFKDPTFRFWYAMSIGVILIAPMLALSWWYHSNITKTPGGRALMRRHTKIGVSRLPSAHTKQLSDAAGLAGDIAKGNYGTKARAMQHRVYWLMGLWIVAVALYAGLMIWADAMNRPAP